MFFCKSRQTFLQIGGIDRVFFLRCRPKGGMEKRFVGVWMLEVAS